MKKKIFCIFLVSMMVGSLFTPLNGISNVYAEETEVVTESSEDYVAKTQTMLDANPDTMRYVVKDENGDWNEIAFSTYNKDGQIQITEDGGSTWRTSVFEFFNRGISVRMNNELLYSSTVNADSIWKEENEKSSGITGKYVGSPSQYIDFPEIVGLKKQAQFVELTYMNIEVMESFSSNVVVFSYCNVIFNHKNNTINNMAIIGDEDNSSLLVNSTESWPNLKYIGSSNKDYFSEIYNISQKDDLMRVMGLKDKEGNYLSTDEIIDVVSQNTFDNINEYYGIASSLDDLRNSIKNNMQTPSTQRIRMSYSMSDDEIMNAKVGDITSVTVNSILYMADEAIVTDNVYNLSSNYSRDYPTVNLSITTKVADNAVKSVQVEGFNTEINLSNFTMKSNGSYSDNSRFISASEGFAIITGDGFQSIYESTFKSNPLVEGYSDKVDIRIDNGGVYFVVLNVDDENEYISNGFMDEESKNKYQIVTTEDGSTMLVKKQDDGSYGSAQPITGTPEYDSTYVEDKTDEGEDVYKEVTETIPNFDGDKSGYVTDDGTIYVPSTEDKYVPNEDGSYSKEKTDGTDDNSSVIIKEDETGNKDIIDVDYNDKTGGYEDSDGNTYYPDGNGGFIEQDQNGTITLPDGTVIEGNEETGENPVIDIDDDGNIHITIPEGGSSTTPDGGKTEYPNGGIVNETGNPEKIVVDVNDGTITIIENEDGNLVVSQEGKEAIVVGKDTVIDIKDSSDGQTDNKVIVDGTDVIFGDVNADLEIINGGNANVTGNVNGSVTVEEGSSANIKGDVTGDINNSGSVVVEGNVTGDIEVSNGGSIVVEGDHTGEVSNNGGTITIGEETTVTIDLGDGSITITEDEEGNLVINQDGKNPIIVAPGTEITVIDPEGKGQEAGNTVTVDVEDETKVNFKDVEGDLIVEGGTVSVEGDVTGDLVNNGGNVTVEGDVKGDVTTGENAESNIEGNVGGDVINNGGTTNVGTTDPETGENKEGTGNVGGNVENNGGSTNVGGSVGTVDEDGNLVEGTGDVNNNGGNVSVGEDVKGDVNTENGGSTDVDGNVEGGVNTDGESETNVGGEIEGEITGDGDTTKNNALKIKDTHKTDDGVALVDSTYTLELLEGEDEFDSANLKDVNWSMEVLGGFAGDVDAYATIDGTKITMNKSGIIKVTAEYKGVRASIVIVKAGDVDRNGRLTKTDALKLIEYIDSVDKDATILNANGEYVEYLTDVNGDGRITKVDFMMLLDIIEGGQ